MDQHPVSVFISYSRADRPRVTVLAGALAALGCDVWWDARIEGGSSFAERIEENLNRADVVLVVWSPTAIVSDWVRDEAGHGRDRRRLVPVSFDRTEPPLGFRQYHVIDLSDWSGDPAGLDEVMRAFAATVRDRPRAGAGSGQQVSAAESPAPPVSAAMAAAVPGRTSWLSRRRLLVAGGIGAVAAAGGLAWRLAPGQALPKSIGVMPLKNISGDPGQDYFALGLTEEIRTALSHISDLQIAAPTSVAQLRDRQIGPREIGQTLDVSYILDGSVRRAGNIARIAVELTETETGFSRWSQSVDRTVNDVFAVQSEVAKLVSDALSVRVNIPPVAEGGTRDADGYDAYLRGIALFLSDSGEDSDRSALAQFEKAVGRDGQFALARASAALVMTTIATTYAAPAEARRLFARALDQARTAAEQAPAVAMVELSLAHALMYSERRVDHARPAFEKAYAMGQGDARIAIAYARFASYLGQPEDARGAIARAVRLDPLNAATYRMAGVTRFYARNYDEAVPLLRKALELKPDIRNPHAFLGFIALLRDDRAAARQAFLAEPQELLAQTGRAILAGREGDRAEADRQLAVLVARMGDNSLLQQAEVLAQWGQSDRALGALERAWEVGDAGILSIKVDPFLDPLRQAPRFSALLNRLGLA